MWRKNLQMTISFSQCPTEICGDIRSHPIICQMCCRWTNVSQQMWSLSHLHFFPNLRNSKIVKVFTFAVTLPDCRYLWNKFSINKWFCKEEDTTHISDFFFLRQILKSQKKNLPPKFKFFTLTYVWFFSQILSFALACTPSKIVLRELISFPIWFKYSSYNSISTSPRSI